MHGGFQLRDAPTQSELAVRVDVEWTAYGPVGCAGLDEGTACTRAAHVWAAVANGAVTFVSSQTTADGHFLWREPTA